MSCDGCHVELVCSPCVPSDVYLNGESVLNVSHRSGELHHAM